MRYKESGKARKQCPQCSFYVHARILTCECGYNFGERKTPVYQQKYLSGKKQGAKLCPSCNKYIGARSKKCICGNTNFAKSTKTATNAVIKNKHYVEEQIIKTENPNAMNYVGRLVLTPSGECPAKLESETQESVYSWCEKVFMGGLKEKKTYTSSALKYWVNLQTSNQTVKNYIDEWTKSFGYEKMLATQPANETFKKGANPSLFILSPKE